MWFLRRMLRISWTAKKSNKTVTVLTQHNHSYMEYVNAQQTFLVCDEKRENRTSCY